MSDTTLLALQITSASLAGLFLILAQFVGLLTRTKYGESKAVQEWFLTIWASIDRNVWLSMPEQLVRRMLWVKAHATLVLLGAGRIDKLTWVFMLLIVIAPGLYVAGFGILLGLHAGILAIVIIIPFTAMFVWAAAKDWEEGTRIAGLLAGSYVFIVYTLAVSMWTLIVLDSNIFFSALIMVALMPFWHIMSLLPISTLIIKTPLRAYGDRLILPISQLSLASVPPLLPWASDT